MSGGSTAFIDDKLAAIKEYARVTKTWGFIADVNFFYKKEAPLKIIDELNDLMKIDIQPWQKDYWTDLYLETGLELYYTHYGDVYAPSQKEIDIYCAEMSGKVAASEDARVLIQDKLVRLMTLFTENHRHLSYGVFILRKRDKKEQATLFGA